MNKFFYPAQFHRIPVLNGGYWVSFPDFPECLTEGNTMEEAFVMAEDALGLALYDREASGESFPTPSSIFDFEADEESFTAVISVNLSEYKRRTNSHFVRKSVSIPGWLNEAAQDADLKLSAVLQKALKEELDIT